MAYLAIRGSGAVNGVSRLHGKVSRSLFGRLFPRWPAVEVPVGHITNGVHMRGWDSAASDDLWTKVCGKDRWLGPSENLERDSGHASNAGLWQYRPTRANVSLNMRASDCPGNWPPLARRPRLSRRQGAFLISIPLRWVLRAASRPTKGRTCCCTTRRGCFVY